MSICRRTHTADRAQPYTTTDAGKPLQRLRGSKHGPLFGGGDEVDAYGGCFSLQGKRPKNTLVWRTLARTQQVRRVHADQLLWANFPGYCAPQSLAYCPVAEMKSTQIQIWKFKGKKSVKIERSGLKRTVTRPYHPKTSPPHSGGPPERVGKTCSHVGERGVSLSQNDTP